jgi:hypothetical protein
MPTIFSHPAVPLALGFGLGKEIVSGRLVVAGVAASILPDLDPFFLVVGNKGDAFRAALGMASLRVTGPGARLHSRKGRITVLAQFAL